MKHTVRYNEIDIAKGIGILLVVIGHAVPDANTGIKNVFWGGYSLGYTLSTWRCLWLWQACCSIEESAVTLIYMIKLRQPKSER